MKQVVVRVPGKLFLMGEHAVVYGHPALVMAVDRYLTVTANIRKDKKNCLIFSVNDKRKNKRQLLGDEVSADSSLSYLQQTLKNFFQRQPQKHGVDLRISSELSGLGLGSSAAVTAGVAAALFALSGINISTEALFEFCYKVVSGIEKKASGADLAGVISGGVIFYQDKGRVRESLAVEDLPLLVIYSGTKAPTSLLVDQVGEKLKTHPEGVRAIFDNITSLTLQAKKALAEKDYQRLGKLMNFQQDYLEDLGVSTGKINNLVTAARQAGAWGAKISGAGGGDCIIALVPNEKRKEVLSALESAGGKILDVKIDPDGIRVL